MHFLHPNIGSKVVLERELLEDEAVKESNESSLTLSSTGIVENQEGTQNNKIECLTKHKKNNVKSETDTKKKVAKQIKKTKSPHAPKFRVDERAKGSRKIVLSSEDREIIEVQKTKSVETERMKKSKKKLQRMKVLSANPVRSVIRSTKQLTIPTTPVSHVARRKGKKPFSSIASVLTKEEEDLKRKKVKQTTESFHNRGPTQPAPFKFATDLRIGHSEVATNSAPVSVAELVQQFHLNPRSQGAPNISLKVTEPRAPSFRTDARSKSSCRPKPLSREEIEEAIMKNAEKHPFKAKTVDRKVRERQCVTKVSTRSVTEPQPFHFLTDSRLKMSKSIDISESQTKSNTKKIKPEDFCLSTSLRGETYQAMLKARIEKEREAEIASRTYHAKAVPNYTKRRPSVAPKPTKKSTEFEEFELRGAYRHQASEEAMLRDIENMINKNRAESVFRACKLPKSTFEPNFKPKKEARKPLVTVEPKFESDIRMQKRKEFDGKIAKKIFEDERLKEVLRLKKLEDEENEIKELRRKPVSEGGLQFVAAPIQDKDLFPTKPITQIPLTDPKSPFLLTKARASNTTELCE